MFSTEKENVWRFSGLVGVTPTAAVLAARPFHPPTKKKSKGIFAVARLNSRSPAFFGHGRGRGTINAVGCGATTVVCRGPPWKSSGCGNLRVLTGGRDGGMCVGRRTTAEYAPVPFLLPGPQRPNLSPFLLLFIVMSCCERFACMQSFIHRPPRVGHAQSAIPSEKMAGEFELLSLLLAAVRVVRCKQYQIDVSRCPYLVALPLPIVLRPLLL